MVYGAGDGAGDGAGPAGRSVGWHTDGTLMHWNDFATLKLVVSHKNLIFVRLACS